MRMHYSQTISQNPKRLQEYQRQLRGTSLAFRVRLLRLLQTAQMDSLPQAAKLLGYGTV